MKHAQCFFVVFILLLTSPVAAFSCSCFGAVHSRVLFCGFVVIICGAIGDKGWLDEICGDFDEFVVDALSSVKYHVSCLVLIVDVDGGYQQWYDCNSTNLTSQSSNDFISFHISNAFVAFCSELSA